MGKKEKIPNSILENEGISIARPKAGRMRRIQELNLDNGDIDTLIQATKICLEGPIEEINWEETDIREMQEVLADFLFQVNKTAAARLKSLIE